MESEHAVTAAKPPPRVHATETFWTIVTVLLIFTLLTLTVLAVVDAYTP